MRRMLLMTVCVLLAANGLVVADDAKGGKDPQIENIKTLRTTLMNKLPGFLDAFDNDHNGINTAANSIQKAFQDSMARLNKNLETENAKTGDAHDKAAVDALTAKIERCQALWGDRSQNYAKEYNQKMSDLTVIRVNLYNLANDMTSQDQVWLRADCDRALLIAIFTEMNKRVDEVKEQVSTLVASYLKRCADDERVFQE